jgi:hypothetical protein
VASIFPASISGSVQDNNLVIKEAQSVLGLVNQLGQKAASIQTGLSAVNDFINQLGATGVYTITLPPFAGGYLNRLVSEYGAPPTDPSFYSCGIVCVAESDGIDSLTSQFGSLQKILVG